MFAIFERGGGVDVNHLSSYINIILIGLLVANYVVKRATITERALYEKNKQSDITLQTIGDAVIMTDFTDPSKKTVVVT